MQNSSITTYKNIIYKITICSLLFFSCFARILAYLQNRPLWHDECSLALSIVFHNIKDYFLPLAHEQCAPFGFLAVTKIFTNILGNSEYVLRLLPFLCSILSVLAFYFLTKSVFNKWYCVLVANALFAVNLRLIYYAQEFKQYSCEVFFVTIGLLFFLNFDCKKITLKNSPIYAIALFLPFLFSYSYAFVLVSYIFYEFVRKNKTISKGLSAFALLTFLLLSFYSIFVSLRQGNSMYQVYGAYWSNGFLKPTIFSFINLFSQNLSYFFCPNKFVLFQFLLAFFGFCALCIKKEKIFLTLPLFVAIIVSLFGIYPMNERLALWSLPLFIIFIVYCFEFLDFAKFWQKAVAFLCLVFFVFGFSSYNPAYFNSIFNISELKKNFSSTVDARFAVQLVKDNFNPSKGEIIVYNDASDSEIAYYFSRYKINTQRMIMIKIVEYDKNVYIANLSKLKKDYVYYFCIPYDYYERPILPWLDEWIKDNAKEIYFIKTKGKSYVAKVKL